MWDNPRGQLPGTGIRGDGENLYARRSLPGVRRISAGRAVLTGESSSGRPSLEVNVSGSGSGGASSGGQASACAGEERPSLFSDSGNRFLPFNSFAAALSSLGPAERYEAEFMGASEFLNRRVNEELQRAFEAGVPSSQKYITLGPQVNVRLQKVFEVQYLKELHRFSPIQHHLLFRLGLRPQFSLQVQHLRDY